MAILCSDLGLLYIQVPGTGCSVVSKLLVDRLGGAELGRKHNDVAELLEAGELTDSELSDLTVVANIRNPYDRLVTYFQRYTGSWTEDYFDWVRRDAQRRLESGLIDESSHNARLRQLTNEIKRKRRRARVLRLAGFNLWLQTTLIRRHGCGSDRRAIDELFFPMLGGVHMALRQEALEAALSDLFSRLGVGAPIDLPRRNVTGEKRPYASYYNTLSRLLVDRLAGEQICSFGYGFDNASDETPLVDLLQAGSEPHA